MPRTIDEGFRDFLARLTPSSAETEAAKSHRASIEARLQQDFGLRRFARIGSFGNGTSISGYSDVDYLASLSNSTLTSDSAYSLGKVRDALDNRFPHTGVRVNCPAVVVPFGTAKSETTEIVPADYVTEENGHKVYDIPDCDGGWMRASPDAHNSYVASVNEKLYGKVKPLIRYIKAWKYFRQVPISSFYLELWVAKYASGETAIVYDIDIERVLRKLGDCSLADLRDPMGYSGYIEPCKSTALHLDAISKLATAASRAGKAREATLKEDISGAFDWWRLLYNDQFPTYYR